MATAGNGGAGETSQNPAGMSSDEGGNSGISELEQMLKQVTVTRFKFKHPATMEDLPDEILSNIFIRLFARQLAQMRSVSKSWNAILSHSSFVKSHLQRSIHTNNEQILLVFPEFNKPLTQYSYESTHLKPINVIKHIPTNLPMNRVNGLICLNKYSYSDFYIWNPSLSAISTIPRSHSTRPTSQYMSISMRFGYNPKTDDYKLVKVVGVPSNRSFSVKEWLQVEVYSVRKGCWEFITQPFPSHITQIHNLDYLCGDGHHGCLHWQSMVGLKTSSMIVGFDLGSETFHEIPLPDSILHSNHRYHNLGVLDGKLCDMSWSGDGVCEVWVMEEYGVPESWAIRHVFTSSQLGDWRFLYGFTSHNELLLEDQDSRLVLYDPIANKTKFTPRNQHARKIVEYVDSLVWV